MKLLLDTHAVIWWCEDSERLGAQARAHMIATDNEVFVSAVSAMEITTKLRLGKLPSARRLAIGFEVEMAVEGFTPLPIPLAHAEHAGRIDISHKDPFDRLLIAQANIEQMILVSNERGFDAFGVSRLW